MTTTLSDLNGRLRKFEETSDFLRYIQCLLSHPGNPRGVISELTNKYSHIPSLNRFAKAAVNAGSTTVDGWAEEMAARRDLSSAWVSLLSTRTLLGRISFPRADLNTRTLVEVSSGSAGWVSENGPIPGSQLSLDASTLDATKIAGLVFFTSESIASTTESALQNINRSMLNTIGRFSDIALLDPEISAVVGKNPASLTNGLNSVPSTGSTEAAVTTDLTTLLQAHVDAGSDLTELVIVCHPRTAIHWSTLLTTGGLRAYPNVGARGGEVLGVPVLTSMGARTLGSPSDRIVAAINPEGVLVGENRTIEFEASNKVAVQMSDAPGAGGQNMVSLWQTNSVALKFVRALNFKRAATGAVSFMRVSY